MNNSSLLQKFQVLYESFPDLICTLDESGRIMDCNSHILKFFGYKREEAIGRSCLDFISPEYRKQTLVGLEIAKKEGFGKGTDILFIRRDGTKFFGLAKSAKLIDDSNQFTGYLVSIKDNTKLHESIQEGLNRERIIREELEKLIQSKSTEEKILHGARNELQNDVTPIKAYVDILLAGSFGKVSQEQRRTLEVLQFCVNQLTHHLYLLSDTSSIDLSQAKSEEAELPVQSIQPTIGLDPLNVNRMKVQARFEKRSVDEILNRIINYYFTWHNESNALEYIETPKYLIKKIFEILADDEIIELSKSYSREKINQLMKNSSSAVNYESVLTFLKMKAETSGFEFMQYETNGVLKISIIHRMGLKWSLFFMSTWENVINDMGCRVESEYSEDSVLFNINVPRNSRIVT